MRYLIAVSFVLSFSSSFAQEVNIIPQPDFIKMGKGFIYINNETVIVSSEKTKKIATYLADYLKKNYGVKCKIVATSISKNSINLSFAGTQSDKEGFGIGINNNGIWIEGDKNGIFYGIQTLIQLLPIQDQKPKSQKTQLSIPQLTISDYPRFTYRGMHLDVSRHFFPVDFIKKYIDYLALHKFNNFHWHLTDDQGWRIEIKKYPTLTSVGGWRNGTIIGRYPGTGNDGIKYGGFYTQEQIKEVVKYATDRYITVIPEIEMPGHSSAAIAAYPELSCFPNEPSINYFPKQCAWSGDSTGKQVQQTWGVFDDVFCAGQENTFKFLEDVMDEVLDLFPSKYIHVGGDECPKENWKRCPNCQKRMKDNNLKDEHELQSYFIQRMEKYLNKKGRTLIGWDEILEGGLAPNAVVMSWRGEKGGIDAAKENHDVIMTPGNPVYFDHTQSQNEDSVTIGGYNPLEKVYAYEPVPKELNDEQAKHVLGAQANMWTEYMKNTKKVEYMLFPRIAALSEVLWSPKEKKNWDDFQKRLLVQFKRYDFWKVNYSKAYFDLKTSVIPSEDNNGVLWKLESKNKDSRINYNKTLDITDPPNPPAFHTYTSPVEIYKSGEYSGWSVENGRNMQNTITQKFSLNKATGKKITLEKQASKNYPGDGPFTLVNGVQNEKGMSKTKEFLGFSGDDCIATVDLGKTESVSFVKIHYLHHPGSWIHQPSSVIVSVSVNGKDFTSVVLSNPAISNNEAICELKQPASARFIKIHIANAGTIPSGNPGAGNKAWLFMDEIEVN